MNQVFPKLKFFAWLLLFFCSTLTLLKAEDPPAAATPDAAAPSAEPAAPAADSSAGNGAGSGSEDLDEDEIAAKARSQADKQGKKQKVVPHKPLNFYMNMSDLIKVDFEIGNVEIGNPDILDFKQSTEPDEIKVTPKAKGFTNMTVFDSKNRRRIIFEIEVADEDLGRKKREIEQLVGPMEGAEIKIIGQNIVVDGEFILPKELRRLFRILNIPRYGNVVMVLATISPLTLELLSKRMEREINNPDVSLKVLNQRIVVSGTVDSNDQKEEIRKIINAYLPPLYIPNAGSETFGKFSVPSDSPESGGSPILFRVKVAAKANPLAKADMAKFTIQFVNMSRSFTKQFQFAWSPLIVDQAGSGGSSSSSPATGSAPPQGSSQFQFDLGSGNLFVNIVGTVMSLFPRLSSAEAHGHAKVLRAATLLIPLVEGDAAQAAITNGPELTIPSSTGQATSVSLKNEITIDKVRRIPNTNRLSFTYKIGFASGGQGSGGAITKDQVQVAGTLVLSHMESAAVGGVLAQDNRADYNTPVPGSTTGTPLFNFNRGRNSDDTKSQTIIFITPAILKRASDGLAMLKRKFKLRKEIGN